MAFAATLPPSLRRHAYFIRYALVGALNAALDFGLFTLLVALVGLVPQLANAISITVIMFVSYILNREFVWRSKRHHAIAFLPFVAVTLLSGLVVQSLVITFVLWAGGYLPFYLQAQLLPLFAKACAMGVAVLSNYFGYRFIFKKG